MPQVKCVVTSDFLYITMHASYMFILFTFYFSVFVLCDNFWNYILGQSCWLQCIFFIRIDLLL